MTMTIRSLSITTHHSHLSLPLRLHNSPTPFRFLPFSSSSLHFSPLKLSPLPSPSPSPSPLPLDDASHRPQHAFTHLLQTLRPLLTVTLTVTALFFTRLHLNPALAAVTTPVAESAAAETISAKENESAIKQKLNENPNNTDALRSLVKIKVKAGEIGEAIQLFERLINLEPEELDWLILKAYLHIYNGEYELAGEVFEQVLRRDPICVDAFFGVSMVACKLNKPIEDFTKRMEESFNSCEEQKMDLSFKMLSSRMKAMEENFCDAMTFYQELVKEEPQELVNEETDELNPFMCRCFVYSMLRKKDEAQKQFDKFRS